MSSPTSPLATLDLTVSGTSINKFLKLMLDDISTLAPISLEMTTLVHQRKLDTEEAMNMSDKTLTKIPEETTADAKTLMDVVQPMPAVDPSIHLATPMVLPSPLMITTVATARYIPPVHFWQ
uniref:Antifreeze protein n=1 Tax=Romanomermis culicivorax TaxID=13658 RepID=A0A915HZD0_ROMCU